MKLRTLFVQSVWHRENSDQEVIPLVHNGSYRMKSHRVSFHYDVCMYDNPFFTQHGNSFERDRGAASVGD